MSKYPCKHLGMALVCKPTSNCHLKDKILKGNKGL